MTVNPVCCTSGPPTTPTHRVSPASVQLLHELRRDEDRGRLPERRHLPVHPNPYTDAGWPLLAKRRAPHVWDKGQRGRVFMESLQLDFNVGQAPASGMGSNPRCKLRISRDGGHTFGDPIYAPMGQIGEYRTRTMYRKLGWGRDNVVDIEVIDPVNRDLVGATLKAYSQA